MYCYRDMVKQGATMVDTSTVSLASGALYPGFRTFATAYGATTLGWNGVPVKVERANGDWAIGLTSLNAACTQLTIDGSFVTSTGAPLGLAADEEVTVSVVATASAMGGLQVDGTTLPDEAYSTSENWDNWFGALDRAAYRRINTGYARQALMAGGVGSIADGQLSIALGSYCWAVHDGSSARGLVGYTAVEGQDVYGGYGRPDAFGGAVLHMVGAARGAMGVETTDATPTALRSRSFDTFMSATGAYLADAGVTWLRCMVSAVQTDGTTKRWTLDFAVKTAADYSATALHGAVTKTVVQADAAAAAWDVNVTVNSGASTFSIEATGEAAKNISWGCSYEGHHNIAWNN